MRPAFWLFWMVLLRYRERATTSRPYRCVYTSNTPMMTMPMKTVASAI